MALSKGMPFSKYHGLGNHFLIVDNREGLYDFSNAQFVRRVCCMRTGVGANCLLELVNCRHNNHKSCAYEFLDHLASGKRGGFCGTGSWCVAKFARKLGIVTNDDIFTFCGPDGQHWGRHFLDRGLVEVSIRDVTNIYKYGPDTYYAFSGSPHHLEFVKDVQKVDLKQLGDEIRFDSARYPEGVNVMIVDENQGQITMRSYERSIDNETWSCGTGTVAVAMVNNFRANKFNASEKEFIQEIKVRLGKMHVKATRTGEYTFTNISLIGPASHVFDGTYYLD